MEGKDWIIGKDYTIADIAIGPWLRALDFYGVKELLEWDQHKNLVRYLDRFLERPAVQKGLVTPPRELRAMTGTCIPQAPVTPVSTSKHSAKYLLPALALSPPQGQLHPLLLTHARDPARAK